MARVATVQHDIRNETVRLLLSLVEQTERAVAAVLADQPPELRRLERHGLSDRLECRGLVQRRALDGDRRVRVLSLTPAGEHVVR